MKKPTFRISSVPGEIRSEYLPYTSLKLYHSARPLEKKSLK
jgi:hypothetical protein